MTNFATGTVIDSRYELLERLGDGGMGVVYKAREIGLERTVALKLLHGTLVGDSENLERFKREGKVLSELEQPHILHCYRFGVWNGSVPYIAMEFLQGRSLNSESGSMAPSRVLFIAQQVCEAMSYAHKHNVVHRDLKPANIMLVDEPSTDFVKIVDFGLARLLPESKCTVQHLTQTGALIGSIYYMSPEQCQGRKADVRSDIYSLGCILYQLLSGEPPLMADTAVGLMHLHVHTLPEPLGVPKDGSKLPTGLNSVLMKSMAKLPEHRFQSMAQFGSALSLVASGEGYEDQDLQRAPAKSKGILRVCSLVSLILALVGVGFVVGRASQSESQQLSIGEITSSNNKMKLLNRNLPPLKGASIEQLTAWLKRNGDADKNSAARANIRLYELCLELALEHREKAKKLVQFSMTHGKEIPICRNLPSESSVLFGFDSSTRTELMEAWLTRYGDVDKAGSAKAHLCIAQATSSESQTAQHQKKAKQLITELLTKGRNSISDSVAQELFRDLVYELRAEDAPLVTSMECALREFGKYLAPADCDHWKRQLALLMCKEGNYDSEQALLSSISFTSKADAALLARSYLRQKNLAKSKQSLQHFSDYPNSASQDFEQAFAAAKALIELNQPKEAENLWDREMPKSIIRQLLLAYCLTEQRDYLAAREKLLDGLSASSNSDSNSAKDSESWIEKSAEKRLLFAGLVHNSVRGGLPREEIIEECLRKAKAQDVALWIIPLANSCLEDDPSFSERLAFLATKLLPVGAPDVEITAVAKTLNDVKKPQLALDFLRKQFPLVSNVSAYEWSSIQLRDEYSRTLCLTGQPVEAEKILQPIFEWLPRHQSSYAKRFLPGILTQRAIVFRLGNRLPESYADSQKAMDVARAQHLGVWEKVSIMNEFRRTCLQAGDTAKAKYLQQEIEQLLPAASASVWKRNWIIMQDLY